MSKIPPIPIAIYYFTIIVTYTLHFVTIFTPLLISPHGGKEFNSLPQLKNA